jgi:hypothetical protein
VERIGGAEKKLETRRLEAAAGDREEPLVGAVSAH